MATSNIELATPLLKRLEVAGIRYAVLHGEDHLSREGRRGSDVDVAVDCSPIRALHELLSTETHLWPILLWNYDIGSYTSFWVSSDLSEYLQFDLLNDPRGRSKYGLKTDNALDRRIQGTRFWRLDRHDELLYLCSKRWYKGDGNALHELGQMMNNFDDPGHVLSNRATARVDMIQKGRHPTLKHRRTWADWVQLVRRLCTRIVNSASTTALIDGATSQEDAERVRAQLSAAALRCVYLQRSPNPFQRLVLRTRPGIVLVSRPDGCQVSQGTDSLVRDLAIDFRRQLRFSAVTKRRREK